MLKLTVSEYDRAIGVMALELSNCERMLMQTPSSKALMMLEALGEHFDVTPQKSAMPADGPFANDDTEALLTDYWADPDDELAFANALLVWIAGEHS
jgi:hypothetical protein